MENPFDSFRNRIAGGKVDSGPARVTYTAHLESNKNLYRLKVRPKGRAWHRFNYSDLGRMIEDGLHGENVVLVFSVAVISIAGRNLQAIADSIDNRTCELIQDFDAERWPPPTDEKVSFIESIHIEWRNQRAPPAIEATAVKTRT